MLKLKVYMIYYIFVYFYNTIASTQSMSLA